MPCPYTHMRRTVVLLTRCTSLGLHHHMCRVAVSLVATCTASPCPSRQSACPPTQTAHPLTASLAAPGLACIRPWMGFLKWLVMLHNAASCGGDLGSPEPFHGKGDGGVDIGAPSCAANTPTRGFSRSACVGPCWPSDGPSRAAGHAAHAPCQCPSQWRPGLACAFSWRRWRCLTPRSLPGCQRLRFCGGSYLSHTNELDTGGALGGGRCGICTSQLHGPHRRPPCSCMATLLPPSQPHTSPHTPQPHGPRHHPPRIFTCHIAMHRAAVRATSPSPSQLRGHVAASLAAAHVTAWAMSLHVPTVCSPPTDGKPDPYASPYASGSSFFFKIKFDKPYMIYCEARDHKVAVIEGREGESSEEQDEVPRDKDLHQVGEEEDQESPKAL